MVRAGVAEQGARGWYAPCSSSNESSGSCFPSTELCVIAFSSSALPYEKYKSAVSGASSPCVFVLSRAGRSEHGAGRAGTCNSHQLERRRVVLHGLFVFFEREGAFGMFNGVFERHRRVCGGLLCLSATAAGISDLCARTGLGVTHDMAGCGGSEGGRAARWW